MVRTPGLGRRGSNEQNRSLAGALAGWHVCGVEADADGIRETMWPHRAAGGQAQLTDFGSSISGYVNFGYGHAGLILDLSAPPQLRAEVNGRMPDLIPDPHLRDVARHVYTFTEVVRIDGQS